MRISANAIDEEQCSECESDSDSLFGARVKVVIKDPRRILKARNPISEVIKRFQSMSLATYPHDMFFGPLSSSYKMEGSHPSEDEKPSHSKPFWYSEMKEQLKKEVVEEVLKKILPLNVKKEELATQRVVHSGVYCNSCNKEVQGIRYMCGNCKDFDLCERCESVEQNVHDPGHVFLKIRTTACFVTNEEGGLIKIHHIPHREGSVAAKIHLNKLMPSTAPEIGEEYRAKFICDENTPDGTIVQAGTKFMKSWRVRNTGTKPWTEDTLFILLWGYQELKPSTNIISPPLLKSGEEGTIATTFTAPDSYGHYESYWELHHKGVPFGDTFWCRIRVGPEMMSNCSQSRALRFQHPQFLLRNKRKVKDEKRKRKENRKKDVKQIMDVLTAVHEDQGPSAGHWKAPATSHTTTPNNTPLDLTPPKSPEPREFVVVKSELSASNAKEPKQPVEEVPSNSAVIIEEIDDKASIESLSSSESDSEFVVIPMPKCFSLLNSYPTTENAELHVPKSDLKKWSESYFDVLTPENAVVDLSLEVSDSNKLTSLKSDVAVATERISVAQALHTKDDIEKEVVISNISLSYSPSSTSISIIDSGSSSSTENITTNNTITVQTEIVEGTRRDSSSQAPDLQEGVLFTSQGSIQETSYTFPKFPLALDSPEDTPLAERASPIEERRPAEGATEVKQDGERTIQVLPEGLVTGALLAAATVYNTAKAVISNFQPGKNEEEGRDQSHPTISTAQPMADRAPGLTAAEQLLDMGFCNRTLNEGLLKEHHGDVARVVAELVSLNDNDWYASRHASSTSPAE